MLYFRFSIILSQEVLPEVWSHIVLFQSSYDALTILSKLAMRQT